MLVKPWEKSSASPLDYLERQYMLRSKSDKNANGECPEMVLAGVNRNIVGSATGISFNATEMSSQVRERISR